MQVRTDLWAWAKHGGALYCGVNGRPNRLPVSWRAVTAGIPSFVLTPGLICSANKIKTVFYKCLLDLYVASQHNPRMLVEAEGWNVRSPMKHHLVRLDRIAGELNAWLLAIAIGL